MWNKIQRIYIGDHYQVYPTWKPWANTKAYYKLDGNLNDSSWNNYNSSATGWTLTYPNNKYLSLTSWWVRFSWTDSFYNSPMTINLWEKDVPTSSEANLFVVWLDNIGGNNKYWNFRIVGSSWWFATQADVVGNTIYRTNYYSVTSWVWHNLVATVTPNSNCKLYIDWVLQETKTFSGNLRQISPYFAIWQVWPNYSQSISGNLDEIILENRAWTAEEIKEYYNQTKGKYLWIS